MDACQLVISCLSNICGIKMGLSYVMGTWIRSVCVGLACLSYNLFEACGSMTLSLQNAKRRIT